MTVSVHDPDQDMASLRQNIAQGLMPKVPPIASTRGLSAVVALSIWWGK